MKISIKSDYAARAILGLARHYAEGAALAVEQLADEQGLPSKYLSQILLELKSVGLVRSLRGKEGGYLLAKAPAQITLGQVMRAVHGNVFDTPALGESGCPPELVRAWRALQATLDRASDAITFQQLLEESQAGERMYYI